MPPFAFADTAAPPYCTLFAFGDIVTLLMPATRFIISSSSLRYFIIDITSPYITARYVYCQLSPDTAIAR